MALGIPVILCREAMDPRFSFLSTIMPIYTPENFDRIDWNPPAVDLGPIRQRLLELAGSIISAARASL